MLKDFPVAPILPATDFERAKSFYTQKLGLNIAPGMDLPGLAVFECGQGSMLVIYEKKDHATSDFTQAGFNVTDLAGLVKELTDKGVTFERYDTPEMKTDDNGIAHMGPVQSAFFKDSEGNFIALNQM